MENNLTLSIKQIYFDQIKSGTKKIETREVRPKNIHKYCLLDENKDVIINNDIIMPVKYDTITFLTGAYKGTRPKLIVEVLNAKVYVLIDQETNDFIRLQDENKNEYLSTIIEYKLGKIINV